MSSRALRKLQGDDLGDEEDGGSGEESPPSRGGQAFNAFTLVALISFSMHSPMLYEQGDSYFCLTSKVLLSLPNNRQS